MSDYNEKLAELQQRLDKMMEYQGYFNREIGLIQTEINALKRISLRTEPTQQAQQQQPPPPIRPQEPRFEQPRVSESPRQNYSTATNQTQASATNQTQETTLQKSGIEEFIGKNIISLIGVIITIIGVAIGAKYAIDNNLISPLTRIVFGYIVGFGLLGFAVKLKAKYHNFSAVLLSGGMATMYFITYFAYSYYNLISQISAFSVMVIFTIFTVIAAINYNRQVIAVIGLVGAYAVPFLLSEGSGRVDVLFSYIALINIGILAVSVKKYWRYLLYSSFNVTWLIFIAWFVDKYRIDQHFSLALLFSTVFFLIFYAAIVAYKLLHKEDFSVINIVLLLLNSLLYFGLGAATLDGGERSRELIGFFTLANCVLHFGVSYLVSQVLTTKKTLYFVLGLSLFFLTIAVPIQLERILDADFLDNRSSIFILDRLFKKNRFL